jgi:hypothetical protein
MKDQKIISPKSSHKRALESAASASHAARKVDQEDTPVRNPSPSNADFRKNNEAQTITVHLERIDDIIVPTDHRVCNQEDVAILSRSISGEHRRPISVKQSAAGIVLVAGEQWLEVAKKRGRTNIECVDIGADCTDVRMAEIAEILYHAALKVLDRADLIAEYARLWDGLSISGQDVRKVRVGRPENGIARAARHLCVPGKTEEARRKFIERAIKISSITLDAKEAARRAGLDDIQSALLAVASEVTAEAQVAKVCEWAQRKRKPRVTQTTHAQGDKGTAGNSAVGSPPITSTQVAAESGVPSASIQPENQNNSAGQDQLVANPGDTEEEFEKFEDDANSDQSIVPDENTNKSARRAEDGGRFERLKARWEEYIAPDWKDAPEGTRRRFIGEVLGYSALSTGTEDEVQ